jgi:hypothetical protein
MEGAPGCPDRILGGRCSRNALEGQRTHEQLQYVNHTYLYLLEWPFWAMQPDLSHVG